MTVDIKRRDHLAGLILGCFDSQEEPTVGMGRNAADLVLEDLKELLYEPVTVNVEFIDGRQFGVAGSFLAGEAMAYGYFKSFGDSGINIHNQLKIVDPKTGKYTLMGPQGIIRTGEDYDRDVLLDRLREAQKVAYEHEQELRGYDTRKATLDDPTLLLEEF